MRRYNPMRAKSSPGRRMAAALWTSTTTLEFSSIDWTQRDSRVRTTAMSGSDVSTDSVRDVTLGCTSGLAERVNAAALILGAERVLSSANRCVYDWSDGPPSSCDGV